MNITEFQKKATQLVDKIDSIKDVKHDVETTLIHLYEELGELSRQVSNKKIKRDKTDISNLKEEIADIYLLLAKFASIYKINLEEAINNKIKVLEKRHNLKCQKK